MKRLLIAIIFSSTLFTCTKEEITSRIYPRVRTTAVVNIAETGVIFRGEITFSSSDIIDHGFIWSTNKNIDLLRAEKIRLGLKSGIGVFEGEVGFGLVQDEKYYFKAFAQSKTHIVYGETLEFISLGSLAPIIEDFTPKVATWNDTIVIKGKNLAGVVRFGDKNAVVVEHDDKTMKVLVPTESTQIEESISILFSGNTSISSSKFKLLPPAIFELSPLNGKFGEVVTIQGKYFHPSQLVVKFNGIDADIITRTSSKITCKIPSGLEIGFISVEVISGFQNAVTQETFFYEAPRINEIIPADGTYGDIVVIKGDYFGAESTIKFEDEVAEVISTSATEIKVKVPDGVAVPKPKVTINYNQQKSKFSEFNMLPPTITGFSPERVTTQTEVVIAGDRFSPFIENNIVSFGGVKGEIISATSTEIRVLVPDSIAAHEMQLEVKSSGSSIVANSKIKSPWALVSSFPYYDGNQQLTINHYLVAKNKMYVIATPGNSNANSANFYELNPASNTLIRKADFPVEAYYSLYWSCFIDNKLYVGTYPFQEVYEYNMNTDSWQLHSEILFATHNLKFGLSSNLNGFMFNYDQEFWKYESITDSWIQKSNLPDIFPYTGFGFDNQLFVIGNSPMDNSYQMWQYNVPADTWSMITSDFPGELGVVFGLENKGFLLTKQQDLYKFNSNNNTWEQDLNFPFSIYWVQFISNHHSSKTYFFDYNNIWEFDPNF